MAVDPEVPKHPNEVSIRCCECGTLIRVWEEDADKEMACWRCLQEEREEQERGFNVY